MIDDLEDHHRFDYNHHKLKKMQYSRKPDVIALTHQPKILYRLFNLFELELNRFNSLPEFIRLHNEIISFNNELENWKNDKGVIRNIYATYHLYQNLFSRIKYTSSLVLDRKEAQRAYIQIARWFAEQKPKVRNQAPEKEKGILKQNTDDKETEAEIDSLLVSQCNKRQLKAYQIMARTSHGEFFPPKERLMEYKRRDLIEGQRTIQRRAFSVSNISKGMARYRGSFATTRTSFKSTTQAQARDEQKPELKQIPAVAPFTIEQPQQGQQFQIDDAVLDDAALEKQVHQQQILQQNMVPIVNEEDQNDGEDQIYSEEDKKESYRYQKYSNDLHADDEMKAEENIKDAKQSTLRRILKQKQQTIRRKLEELNFAEQAHNWGGIKSRRNTDQHRKLERLQLANKFKQLEFIPKTLAQKQAARKRDIPQFESLYRSKSSRPGAIEGDIEKLKINNALKTYGKYINHVNIVPIKAESEEEQQQIRAMRSTSLTSFCRQGKKTPFSSIVEQHGVERQNEEATQYMVRIKDKLAKTSIPVQKREILMGMYIANPKMMDLPESNTIYPPKKDMLNNPFFPKQTKSKKKKK